MPDAMPTDLLAALAALQRDDWDQAHELVQRHEGTALADWLHAVLHRIEGDTANARYWYQACDRLADSAKPIPEQLTAIRIAATASGTSLPNQPRS
jgi:hypothetical protein